jgi:methylenetetrahydrofolate reductase (NADH)
LKDTPGRLATILSAGQFAVTTEVTPPRSADPSALDAEALGLVGYADAVNVVDNPRASAHMSATAGAALLARAGLEPILQLTCRDRNRLALSSDLLGGWALGARGLLALFGDPIEAGDDPDATAVSDLSVLELVELAAKLRDDGVLLSGAEVDSAPRYLVGVADAPLAVPYDPARLEAKLDSGADFVQTQIAYDVEALAAWADVVRARGLLERASVLIGVAPLRSARQARFMNEKLFGVNVPRTVIEALEDAGARAEDIGVTMAVQLVGKLRAIPGVAGVHLMAMGRDDIVRRVVEGAGLFPRPTGVDLDRPADGDRPDQLLRSSGTHGLSAGPM